MAIANPPLTDRSWCGGRDAGIDRRSLRSGDPPGGCGALGGAQLFPTDCGPPKSLQERENADDSATDHHKTLDLSPHLEFLVATGILEPKITGAS